MAFHKLPERSFDLTNLNCINLTVAWDSNSDICYAGDLLKGVVHLSVQEPIFVQALTVEIKGISEIAWRDKDIGSKRKDLKIYYHRKQINSRHYDQRDLLSRHIPLIVNTEVYPSQSVWREAFQTKIPDNCVSSCAFEFGFVQYELTASCRTTSGTTQCKHNLKIMKLSNSMPERPLHQHNANKHFNLQTSLPKICFNPGDDMQIQTKVLVPQTLKQYKLGINIIQYVTYNDLLTMNLRNGTVRNYDEHLTQKRLLATLEMPLEKNKAVQQEVSQCIQLPAGLTPSTHVTENHILNIHYELHLLVIQDTDKVCLQQEIPIKVQALRPLVEENSFNRKVEAVQPSQPNCCLIYKKERNSVLQVLDTFLKYN